MLTFQTITDRDAYTAQRFTFIKTVEGSESWPYIDSKGIATIGIGFNLQVDKNRDEVFKVLGINPRDSSLSEAGKAKELAYQNEIIEILKKTYPANLTGAALDQANANLQMALDAVMQRRYNDPLITIPGKENVFGLSDSQMKSVFDAIMPVYQAKVDNWVTNIPDSKERIALESLAYNTKDGSRSLLGPKLADAIVAGNRAESWYEIRYNSNSNKLPGIANRRYQEAAMFGLYNDSANITVADAKEIMRMYTRHQVLESNVANKIYTYESSYPLPSGIDGIDVSVSIANDYLIQNYAMGNTIDGRVIVGRGLESYNYLEKGAWSDNILAGLYNDLMFGERGNDKLNGGAGNDVIYGGDGEDMLIGSTGNDTLIGGVGNDTYIINAGDGTDTIEDKQGNNKVILCGKEINLLYNKGSYYANADGSIRAVMQGTDLVVTHMPTGSQVILNEDFQWGDFGINLIEVSENPDITNTIYLDIEDPNDTDHRGRYYGTNGNDLIVGGNGNDEVITYYEQAGNDWLQGGGGNDLVQAWAGPGSYLLEGNSGVDAIFGSYGSDKVFCADYGEMVELITAGEEAENLQETGDLAAGGPGNDFIYGSNARDGLFGGPGNDLLVGGGADDVIFGDCAYLGVGQSTSYWGWSFSVNEALGVEFHNVPLVQYLADYEAGDDVIYAGTGNDYVDGFAGDDEIYGGNGHDTVFGDRGNDFIEGGAGDDILIGDDNNLAIELHGDDYIDGGEGNDSIEGQGGRDELFGGNGLDTIYGGENDDYLDGEAGNDTLYGGDGNDQIFGGEDNDYIEGDYSDLAGNDYLDGEAGDDTIIGAGGADQIFGGDGNDQLVGDADNILVADQGDDYIDGEAGNDLLLGYAGNDTLIGGDGNDSLYGGSGDDYIDAGDGANTIYGDDGNSEIYAGSGDDYIEGGAGSAYIDAGDGNNTIFGGNGTNEIYAGIGNDQVVGGTDADYIDAGDGGNLVESQAGNDVVFTGVGNDSIWAGAGADEVYSGDGNDAIYLDNGDANDAADFADGGAGDDTIVGGSGNDSLYGSDGNDYLQGDGGSDTYVFGTGDGSDIIENYAADYATTTDTIQIGANLCDVTVTKENNDLRISINGSTDSLLIWDWFSSSAYKTDQISFADGTLLTPTQLEGRIQTIVYGTAANDSIIGGSFSNTIYGYAGNDTIYAGAGNDTIYGNEGDDNIFSNDANYGENGNNLLDGGDGNDWLVAGDGLDTLIGGAGDDRLWCEEGGLATMIGGLGNDRYCVDDSGDVIIENTGEGYDEVFIFATQAPYVVSDNIEAITLELYGHGAVGNALDNTMTGNISDNELIGMAGSDTIYGMGGSDTIDGGAGNDELYCYEDLYGGTSYLGNNTYIFGRGYGQDYVIDYMGNADVISVKSEVLPADITLNRQNNDLVLAISGTTDTMTVADWFNDTNYRVEQIQFADGTTWDASYIESNAVPMGTDGNDLLNGTGADNRLMGLAGNDTLNGYAGNDTLDGGTGADSMVGGFGDDTYVVDNAADVISENANEGTDTVQSAISYTLGNNIDNVSLIGNGMSLTATGNALNNVLVGNGYYDTLNGGAGADTMHGYGVDTYVVDNVGDVVIDEDGVFQGEGHTPDTILSSVTYVLPDGVDDLTLTGSSAINGSGNDLENSLLGNSAVNMLTGGAGNDTLNGGTGADNMCGGQGNDTYIIDNTGDIVTENLNEGSDTVQSSVTYTLGSNIENLFLTGTSKINGTGNALDNLLYGNSAINNLTGGAGNDVFYGNGGADTFIGGAGDDTYYVYQTDVAITENANEGTDTVYSTVSYSLSGNIENLYLVGGGALNGMGNAQNNYIAFVPDTPHYENYNNIINGGAGADTMSGGYGSDTYIVDNIGDIVIEGENSEVGQRDIIQSSVTYTLPYGVEDLTLTGTSAISGTGNELWNNLVGNSASNSLTGGAGNDTLNGGTGADSLSGGMGDDLYIVDNTGDIITEIADEGSDTVQSSITYTLGNNVEKLTLTGSSRINGTGNALDNYLTGNSANNTLTGAAGNDTLDGGSGSDTMVGGAGNDTYIVQATGDVVTENANEGTDLARSSITYTLGNNVENLTLTGTSAINGTGNALDNTIIGNSAANTLTGNAGNDTLNGGAGNDAMVGGAGNDVYYVDSTGDTVTESANSGTDTVLSSITHTLGSNVENLTLTETSSINGTGNALDNNITGNSGNNTLNGGAGNDTYVFSNGGGTDVVTDSGADSSTQDIIRFQSDVLKESIAIFQGTSDLSIAYGSTDNITVTSQTSTNYGIEKVQLDNGLYMTATDINQLIQNMATFATAHNLAFSSVNDVKASPDLMAMVSSAWHS